MKEGLFSVLIPCYNHEKYIKDLFNSLIEQKYNNLEILICDDCSVDNSWEIINTYEDILNNYFSKVVIIKNNSNEGITKTLNRLLDYANGEFIKVIASDDMLDPQYFRRVYEVFLSNNEIDVVATNGWIVDDETHFEPNIKGIGEKCIIDKENSFNNECLFEQLYNGNIFPAPGLAFRKSVYEKVGKYDENTIIEDWEFLLRVAHNRKNFFWIKDCLFYYRKSINSVTSQKDNNLEKRMIKFFLAEIYIIDKYGLYISHKTYVKRRIDKIYDCYDYAISHKFIEMKKIMKKKKHFSLINVIDYGIRDYLLLKKKRIRNTLRRMKDRFKSFDFE